MRVSDVAVSFKAASCEFRATVGSDAHKEPLALWYRLPAELGRSMSHGSGNALLAALLLPAMRHSEPLELPLPLSPRLARSINRIQAIYHAWEPSLSIVDVIAPLRENHAPLAEHVGLFFSLGIDSLYSLTRNTVRHPLNEDEITHLIVVRGLDTWLKDDQRPIFDTMLANAQAIGDRLGKHVLDIETNIKYVLADLGCPAGLRHGASLMSVGLLLELTLHKIYIASGITYADPIPDANHPILDPFWSAEGLSFVHDGCEATRLQKTCFLCQFQYALDALRVCWDKEATQYNCGCCSKCLRTMLELHVAGALGRCPTLPGTIELEQLRRFPFLDFYDEFYFFPELLNALERSQSDDDAAILAALREGIAVRRGFFDLLKKARASIDKLIPPQDRFILVDQDTIRSKLGDGRKIFAFTDRNGQFFGLPADDEAAINELERLRRGGAKFILFRYTNFWCLDYYQGLRHHLESNYSMTLHDDSLIVFSLAKPAAVDQNGVTLVGEHRAPEMI